MVHPAWEQNQYISSGPVSSWGEGLCVKIAGAFLQLAVLRDAIAVALHSGAEPKGKGHILPLPPLVGELAATGTEQWLPTACSKRQG